MKNKTFAILIVLFALSSCNPFSSSKTFDSDKLKGKYKIDIAPIIRDVADKTKKKDVFDEIGSGIAKMAFSSINAEISFYKNKKGVLYIDGTVINFMNLFSDKFEKTHEFEYKVEQDSILYMKDTKSNSEYKRWAIVRTFSESYDYVQLVVGDDGKESLLFNLKKLSE